MDRETARDDEDALRAERSESGAEVVLGLWVEGGVD